MCSIQSLNTDEPPKKYTQITEKAQKYTHTNISHYYPYLASKSLVIFLVGHVASIILQTSSFHNIGSPFTGERISSQDHRTTSKTPETP